VSEILLKSYGDQMKCRMRVKLFLNSTPTANYQEIAKGARVSLSMARREVGLMLASGEIERISTGGRGRKTEYRILK